MGRRKKPDYDIRRIKPTDRYIDFDPFDHPFGGRSHFTYPQVTAYHMKNYNFGMFQRKSNICKFFAKTRKEIK